MKRNFFKKDYVLLCATVFAVCVLTGCTKQDKRADAAIISEQLNAISNLQVPKNADGVVECLAFYRAYSDYLKPTHPQQAKSYADFLDAQGPTAMISEFILRKERTEPSNGEDIKKYMARELYQALLRFNTRTSAWDRSLRMGQDPTAAVNFANQCNAMAPQISILTQNMRNDPKLSIFYETWSKVAAKQSQRP